MDSVGGWGDSHHYRHALTDLTLALLQDSGWCAPLHPTRVLPRHCPGLYMTFSAVLCAVCCSLLRDLGGCTCHTVKCERVPCGEPGPEPLLVRSPNRTQRQAGGSQRHHHGTPQLSVTNW